MGFVPRFVFGGLWELTMSEQQKKHKKNTKTPPEAWWWLSNSRSGAKGHRGDVAVVSGIVF